MQFCSFSLNTVRMNSILNYLLFLFLMLLCIKNIPLPFRGDFNWLVTIFCLSTAYWASLVAQSVENLPAMPETEGVWGHWETSFAKCCSSGIRLFCSSRCFKVSREKVSNNKQLSKSRPPRCHDASLFQLSKCVCSVLHSALRTVSVLFSRI